MIVIFVVALSVRLFHLLQISSAPFFSVLVGDARSYDLWAQRLAAGDWLGSDVFYQAPLYPYALGTIYAIAGHDLTMVRGVQAVGGALACVLLGLAGTRLFDKRTGVIAGLMLAVYPPAVFFDGLIQKTSLDALLVCLVLWLVAQAIADPDRLARWAGLGAAIGALCLNRENALILVGVVAAWIAIGPASIRRHRWQRVAAFAAGVALLLVPVAARNYTVGGGFYLTTSQFGPNFYIGNNPGADGTYRALKTGRGTAEFERADAIALAERAEGRTLTARQVSAYWTGRAFDFIRTEPAAWARLMLRKTRLLLNRVEVVDTESQDSAGEWSLILSAGRHVGHFGVLLPLAMIGVWLTRDRLRDLWIVPAMAAAYAASVVAFYVFARYRFPLVPFLVLWAAAGVARLPALLRAGAAREGAGLLAIAAATLVIANWPMLSPTAMQAAGENSLGAALQADGRHAEALDHFRRAIALDPTETSAYVNAGTALQREGYSRDAEQAFRRAIALQPDLAEAHYFLGKSLSDSGRVPDAIVELTLAVPAMPESMDARTALGLALAAERRFDEAIVQFREVSRIEPTRANASWNLGAAFLAAGRFADAIPVLEDAVRRDSSNAEARADLAAARNQRGITLASNGAIGEAIKEFEAALRADPGFADAQQNLATAMQLLSKTNTPRRHEDTKP